MLVYIIFLDCNENAYCIIARGEYFIWWFMLKQCYANFYLPFLVLLCRSDHWILRSWLSVSSGLRYESLASLCGNHFWCNEAIEVPQFCWIRCWFDYLLWYKQVFGVGIQNPYRIRPFLGARVPVNSSFSPLIRMYNPHGSVLQVTFSCSCNLFAINVWSL